MPLFDAARADIAAQGLKCFEYGIFPGKSGVRVCFTKRGDGGPRMRQARVLSKA